MRRILFYIYLCCVAAAAKAFNGQFYSSEKLASSSVTNICQDGYGFIWIATDYGLSRFDGYHFTNYYHMRRDKTTLPDNHVGCFMVDNKGGLWVGHGKGICRYDYSSERFIRHSFPNGIMPRVSAMVQDKMGNIFIGTAGMGMYVMKDGIIRRCGDFSNETDHYCAHLYLDKRGNLWRGNHMGNVYMYVMKGGKAQSCKAFHSDFGEPVSFVNTDGRNVLLVCKKGIQRYDYTTGSLTDAGYDLSVADGDMILHHAYIDPRGNLYLGTYGHGLLVIDKGEKKARRELLTVNNRQQAAPYVSSIMRDRNNNLWLTCYDAGIFLVPSQKPTFGSWRLTSQDSQFAGRVTAIAPDADGGAWCAVRQGALYHLNKEGRILSCIPTQPELCSVCWRQGSYYWLGAGNTLYLLDAATEVTQKRHVFDGIGIGPIISDHHGGLYISVYGKGFCRYDIGSGKIRMFNANMDSPKGKLVNDWVLAMMVDSRGQLWLSTAAGVSCMNTHDCRFNSLGWNTLLEGISCGSLCETKEHNIVVGTNEGLYIYHRSTNRIERFPGSGILDDVNISSITEDSKGNLWIGSLQGIWQYIRGEKRFVSYLNGSGSGIREYVAGAVITFPDGKIILGKRDGLTVFNPSRIESGSGRMGKVRLVRFLRDGSPADFRSGRFTIPYDGNTFSMEFSLLDYVNTDNISFQYRLNKSQWISTTRGSNVISFGKMKPGTYNIDVRAEYNGAISSEVLTLTIVVQAPWYLSTWAVIAYLLVTALMAWLLVRTYNQRKRRELDEEKIRFLINATYDIRSPLTMIMGPLAKLRDMVTDDSGKSYVDTIERNAQRLMLMVSQMLDKHRIDKKQMPLYCGETDSADVNSHLSSEQVVTGVPARNVVPSGSKQPYRQFRILIVDDDCEFANYIIAELGDKYKFDHAINGKEALKTLLTGQYDLVVSDVMMPGMDGIALLRRIKENPNISQLPVIMLTSKDAVEDKLKGLKSGADAYIAKPFIMDELRIQIDNLIVNVHRLRGKFSGALQQEERVRNVEVKGNDEALMTRIMCSVNANMSDPAYTVDELASDVGLSRAQLHRRVKEITGIATGRFLRNLRMEQAARLLREGKVNVSQVASSVGYIDQAHFFTAFKTHFGISPSEYMASNRDH